MILCYHKVDIETPTHWWVGVDAFVEQMDALQRFDVVPLSRYNPTDRRHVVITFDGVYENVYHYAFPIMKKYGYCFELFVIGDYIGLENTFDQPIEPSARFASVAMLKEMIAGGGRVQWHTRRHRRLTALSDADARIELSVPEDLAEEFGEEQFKWFAYPHGSYEHSHAELVRSNFIGALACDEGDPEDKFRLPRKLVFPSTRFYEGTVAAIVANYNYGSYLREAVRSLERQSNPPDEILIVDDCSTDDSHTVLEELQDAGYRVIRNSRNLGIIENFRKAVENTNSDYVFILGADNKLRTDYIRECRNALDSNPDIAVAYTDMLIFGSLSPVLATKVGAAFVGHSAIEKWDVFEWQFTDPTPQALEKFKENNFVHGSSMYRRSWYNS